MKISCPTCSAKYSVADEKIQSRLAKIRCRKCSSTIVIDGTSSPAKVYVGDASAAISPSGPPHDMEAAPGSGRVGSAPAPGLSDPVGPAADEFAVDIADNDQRNMTIHQIVGAYNEGLVTADTYIWKEGMADWQTLAEVKEVAEALHAAARPAAAQPAAVRRSNHNSSADLFGRIHTAGGEDDITTSAPEPSPAMTAGTGARNESSVLFSLSALTGGAAAPVAAPTASGAPARKRNDDSGLIDLQALTASEPGGAAGGGFAAAPNAFGASPLISAPLGGVSGPALGAGGRSSGGRWGLIAAALVLGVALIGGAFILMKGGGSDSEQPAAALDQRPATAPAPAAQPTKEPEPAAAEPEKAEKEDPAGTTRPVAAEDLPTVAADPNKAAPKPAVPKAPRPAAPKPAASPLPPAPTPTAAAEPKPAAAAPKPAPAATEPKKPACVCKPADLLCAMKCSAKKP